MASRNRSPLSFSSIQYTAANKDKRWYIDLPISLQSVAGLSGDSNLAAIVNDLVNGSGSTTENTTAFGDSSVLSTTTHTGDVVVAFRIPQTKRLLDVVMKKDASSDFDSKFDDKSLSYDVYISGRSDKKYSEIIDWVKVCDNTDQQSDLGTNVFLPDSTGVGETYVTNSAVKFHAKFFPYYTSWVKLVFHNVRTVHTGATTVADLFLTRLSLYSFTEDLATAELAPTISMVFPDSGSRWLPSQTVYFTSRVYEPNTDACHFSFEIYKETTGNTTLDSTDTLMYTIDSNALNLDGSVNENYTHTWSGLPVRTNSFINKSFLPGYPVSSASANPMAVLIVPTAGANVGSSVNLGNVKFYDNVGNILQYDAVAKGSTFAAINIPAEGATQTGWLINFKDSNNNPTSLKFNRIDFVNPSSGVNPTRVEVYYCVATVNPSYNTVSSGVWNTNGAGEVFRGPSWESNIEFCWPKVNTVGSYNPSAAVRPLVGYKEGLSTELADDPDSYNPDRSGIGIDQSNAGDWTKVPKFSGILVGPAFQSINTGTATYTASTEYGDSPVPSTASSSGAATILTTGGIIIKDQDLTATPPVPSNVFSTDAAHRIVYVRVALPDPYQDGDRFYAKCKVWDGRTKV